MVHLFTTTSGDSYVIKLQVLISNLRTVCLLQTPVPILVPLKRLQVPTKTSIPFRRFRRRFVAQNNLRRRTVSLVPDLPCRLSTAACLCLHTAVLCVCEKQLTLANAREYKICLFLEGNSENVLISQLRLCPSRYHPPPPVAQTLRH
jgi:hypothetical protein